MNDSAIFGMLGLLIGGGMGFMVGLVLLRRHLAIALEALDERDDEIEAQRAIARLNGEAVQHLQAVIARTVACVTDRSAHVGKKMAAILTGERA